MFCKKCGKFISYVSDICDECKAVKDMPPAYTAIFDESTAAPAPKGSRTYGMGFGIAGIAVGIFSTLFCTMAWLVAFVLSMAKEFGYDYIGITASEAEMFPMVIGVFAVVGIIAAIPAIILGIIAIKKFFYKKKLGEIKPIPALIMGIIAVSEAASGLLLLPLLIM